MRLVFFSSVLNHHQAGVADIFYGMLEGEYCFVELTNIGANKGGTEDYSTRPYLVKAWRSENEYGLAMGLARSAEVCVFAGYEALPFERERLKCGLLSFDMGERLLKRGIVNLLSPRILKMVMAYHWSRWKQKPLYKLCCSAFTYKDCIWLGMFRDRCYKWGYFTAVEDNIDITPVVDSPVTLMWCARFLTLKHPELVLEMAKILKDKGYYFKIDIFGDDKNAGAHEKVFPRERIASVIRDYNLEDIVSLRGSKTNDEILREMRGHDIFLFTSDRMEGWGAVANESLANGCVLIASDAIGSSPYLIEDGKNGFMFESGNAESLAEKVEWLINHRDELNRMKFNAYTSMKQYWNPRQAAMNLLVLIESICKGNETSIEHGPCSKA